MLRCAMRRLALVVLLGCGGSSAKPVSNTPPPPAAPPAPTCGRAVGRVIDVVIADQKATNPDRGDATFKSHLIEGMREAMVESCDGDKWSVELRTCLDTAVTVEASDACKQYLTKEQEDAMTKRMTDAAKNK